ncbi:4-alpha-glucanotransferase [Shewanella sp. SR44-3]|nr:4-alpha-glucanotransferase [Shewanella sp. SR44-3]
MGLEKLLYLQGIGAEFIDCLGHKVTIEHKDRLGILASMLLHKPWEEGAINAAHLLQNSSVQNGLVPASLAQDELAQAFDDDFIDQRIFDLDVAPWFEPVHAFQWCYQDQPALDFFFPENGAQNSVNQDADQKLCVSLISAQGHKREYHFAIQDMIIVGDYVFGDTRFCHYRYALEPNSLELGYFDLSLTLDSKVNVAAQPPISARAIEGSVQDQQNRYQGRLMLAPRKAYSTDFVHAKRPWGLSIQLYSLVSESHWGIGDFGDLMSLISLTKNWGIDFITLNPLHALDIANPTHASPYSPSDRRRLNPLYIHIEAVAEYAEIKNQLESPQWQRRKQAISQEDLIDYAAVHDLKYDAFFIMYEIFRTKEKAGDTARYHDFLGFNAKGGLELDSFCQHEACLGCEKFTAEPLFYAYLQFIAESQLAACQAKAKHQGMSLGLVRDLAVGVKEAGAEVLQVPWLFCQQASIGAPPDPFSIQGQNWGLLPLDPSKLKHSDYEHFIRLVRSNMQSCGALRIDHVMGLLRLWWWPQQAGPEQKLGHGAYVYYPFDTLLAILCLESHHAQCLLIGEDLGTVPPEIISSLANAGIYSNQLFYFCKDHDGFTAPAQYKAQSLMMLANHDVPTMAAWWTKEDLTLRLSLSLMTEDEFQQALQSRNHEKQTLLAGLINAGLIDATHLSLAEHQDLDLSRLDLQQISFESIMGPWCEWVASGESGLFCVQLCDLIAQIHGVNIPGTWKEYPNWRQRLSLSLQDISQSSQLHSWVKTIDKARDKS